MCMEDVRIMRQTDVNSIPEVALTGSPVTYLGQNYDRVSLVITLTVGPGAVGIVRLRVRDNAVPVFVVGNEGAATDKGETATFTLGDHGRLVTGEVIAECSGTTLMAIHETVLPLR